MPGEKDWVPPRGATEGPLSTLIPVFVDVETYIDDKILLGNMTLRQYLARSHMTALAVAVGDEEPDVMDFPDGEITEVGQRTLAVLEKLALDPAYVFVCHNAAFDIRVLRFLCGIPQPCHVWCTMEGAMAAWPDLPGGYGLANCGSYLKLAKEKFELDLRALGKLRLLAEQRENGVAWSDVVDPIRDQITKILKSVKEKPPAFITEDVLDRILLIYNKRDVQTMQELYYRQIPYIPDVEQMVALMTHRVRRNSFKLTGGGLEGLITALGKAAEDAEEKAEEFVTDDSDIRQIFNREKDGTLQSIRYTRLRKTINDKMGAPEIKSTSKKKINPVQLVAHQNVSNLLEQTQRASKMIFHRRRAEVFRNVEDVDTELGYFRAITGRFSSPSTGKGLNLHNCVPGDTPVLTNRGWLPILEIQEGDLVWDGRKMVKHAGVTLEGRRKALTTLGFSVTPEHPVWTGRRMVAIGDATPCQRVLMLVAGCLSNLQRLLPDASLPSAVPAALDSWACHTVSIALPNANDARTVAARRSLLSFLTTLCGSFTAAGITTCSTATGLVATLTSSNAETMWSTAGTNASSSSAIARLCLDGMTWLLRWTGLTWGSHTAPAMSASLQEWSTHATDGTRSLWRASLSSKSHANVESLISVRTTSTARAVYDLRDCGKFQTPVVLCSNCPKRDKAIAKPVRKLFSLPPGFCIVRGDLANVEYRCLLAGTPILTDSGWKKIEEVLDVDLVWDGIEFVEHQGVVCNGYRKVIDVHGVWMTPDHPVLTSNGWVEAAQAAMLTFQMSDSGSVAGLVRADMPKTDMAGTEQKSGASAELLQASRTPICCVGLAENADPAPRPADGVVAESSKTSSCGPSGSSATNACSKVASTPTTRSGSITVVVGSPCTLTSNDGTTSSATSSPSQGGMTQPSLSTAEIISAGMNPGISGARPELSRTSTNDARMGTVYDILNCGPRRQFVAGNLIVHNCEGKLAQCRTIIGMFKDNVNADPYCKAWQAMTSQVINKSMPIRQVSKAAVLGLGFCLDGDTPIPTLRGIIALKDVVPGDRLWNGHAWVKAGGAIKTGRKLCIRLGNTWLTEDHRVWWNGWRTAGEIASSVATQIRNGATATVAGQSRLESSTSEQSGASASAVTAETSRPSDQTNSHEAKVSSAESVQTLAAVSAEGRQGNTNTSYQTPGSVAGGSPLTTTSRSDVRIQQIHSTATTVGEESNSACLLQNGCSTSEPYLDGTTGLSFWTGETTTGTTKLEISGSSRLPFLSETNDLVREEREVYDILDVEDGHRFQAGEWLVHNCMSATGYAKVLLQAIASGDVTIEMLMAIAIELRWADPGTKVDDIVKKLGCDRIVALAAFYIHKAFNGAHPEFRILAEWLVRCVGVVSSTHNAVDQWDAASFALDKMRLSEAAPDPSMIYLDVDPDRSFAHPSVRVQCGPWVKTLCWREPKMRPTMFDKVLTEPKLTIRKSNGTFKAFTPQLAIENVTQAAARNSLCYGLIKLEQMGYMDIIHVHDEVMLIVPKTREAVLKAKADMLEVFGPDAKDKPLEWAILIKEDEITVTQTLYEDEGDIAVTVTDKKTGVKSPGPDRWGKILRNEPGCLENLP